MATDYELISYDFDSLQTDLINKLKTKSEWTDVSTDDLTLQLFIYILTYNQSFLMGTINKTFIDYFPNISSADEAVYYFADYIKMDINGIISSAGTARFYLSAARATSVYITSETEISNADNSIIYSVDSLNIINPGDLYVDVAITQGQWKDINYTSDGTNNQRYYIYEDIALDNTIVTVNGVEWTKVDDFNFYTNLDKVYSIKFIKDGYIIAFSDGVFGAKPQLNDTINIKYLKSLGYAGNIYSANILDTIMSNIYDSSGVRVTDINVINQSQIATGVDADTVDTIKKNISRFFVTNPYITRKEDYIEYIKTNQLVTDCNVYAGWELFADVNTWSSVYIYVVPTNSLYLTADDKVILNAFIKLKDLFNTKIVFEDVVYIGVNIDYVIKFRKANVSQAKINLVEEQIDDITADYFDYTLVKENYDTVFRNIYLTDIMNEVGAITDLRKTNVYFQSVETIETISSGKIIYSKSLDYQDIKINETYLYINNIEVGYYDETWTLIPNAAYVGKISSYISYLELTITILDSNLVNISDPDNIIGDIFYVRSNALNDEDLIADSAGNMVFNLHSYNIEIES
jgi:hypothetical protein